MDVLCVVCVRAGGLREKWRLLCFECCCECTVCVCVCVCVFCLMRVRVYMFVVGVCIYVFNSCIYLYMLEVNCFFHAIHLIDFASIV